MPRDYMKHQLMKEVTSILHTIRDNPPEISGIVYKKTYQNINLSFLNRVSEILQSKGWFVRITPLKGRDVLFVVEIPPGESFSRIELKV